MSQTTQRTLLIVEDDQNRSDIYYDQCELAIEELNEELSDDGLSIDGNILQAFTFDEALAYLREKSQIDFLSLDLALEPSEQNIKDGDKAESKEIGGMRILEVLRSSKQRPVTIVASGETSQTYVLRALQKYQAFTFIQKSRGDELYVPIIKVILRYLSARDLLTTLNHRPTLQAFAMVQKLWQQSVDEAVQMDINEYAFPSHLGDDFEKLQVQYIDTTTRLPTGRLLEEELKRRVVDQEGWALMRVDISYQHTSQQNPLLVFVSQEIDSAVKELSCTEPLIGVRRDGKTGEQYLIVVLNINDASKAIELQQLVEHAFEPKARAFTDQMSLRLSTNKQNSAQIPSIQFHTWMNWNYHQEYFPDWPELLNSLEKTKQADE